MAGPVCPIPAVRLSPADARPRRCFAQRPICRWLGSGCSPSGSGREALRPSTTAPIVGRRRSRQPHRIRKQDAEGTTRPASCRPADGRGDSTLRDARRDDSVSSAAAGSVTVLGGDAPRCGLRSAAVGANRGGACWRVLAERLCRRRHNRSGPRSPDSGPPTVNAARREAAVSRGRAV